MGVVIRTTMMDESRGSRQDDKDCSQYRDAVGPDQNQRCNHLMDIIVRDCRVKIGDAVTGCIRIKDEVIGWILLAVVVESDAIAGMLNQVFGRKINFLHIFHVALLALLQI